MASACHQTPSDPLFQLLAGEMEAHLRKCWQNWKSKSQVSLLVTKEMQSPDPQKQMLLKPHKVPFMTDMRKQMGTSAPRGHVWAQQFPASSNPSIMAGSCSQHSGGRQEQGLPGPAPARTVLVVLGPASPEAIPRPLCTLAEQPPSPRGPDRAGRGAHLHSDCGSQRSLHAHGLRNRPCRDSLTFRKPAMVLTWLAHTPFRTSFTPSPVCNTTHPA